MNNPQLKLIVYTLDTGFHFGQYKNECSLKEIIDADIQYVQWSYREQIFEMDLPAKKYYNKKAQEWNDNLEWMFEYDLKAYKKPKSDD
jgi:hypothetical protein